MTNPGRHGNRRRAGAPRGNAGVGVHDFTPVFPDFDPPRCRAKLPARLATERPPCPTGDALKSRNQSAAAGAGGAARTSVGADNDGRRQLVKHAASPRVRGLGQDRADEQRPKEEGKVKSKKLFLGAVASAAMLTSAPSSAPKMR